MTRVTTVELRVAAQAENVALARLALTGVAMAAGMPADGVADLKLAVSEACTNAVLHAYPTGAADAQVVVRYSVADNGLTVQVTDTGIGFDPGTVTANPSRHASESQMGLSIARTVTDELEIESDAAGTRVTFLKRRA